MTMMVNNPIITSLCKIEEKYEVTKQENIKSIIKQSHLLRNQYLCIIIFAILNDYYCCLHATDWF